ncbi:unnamed protein product [Heterosigma akashiwo]
MWPEKLIKPQPGGRIQGSPAGSTGLMPKLHVPQIPRSGGKGSRDDDEEEDGDFLASNEILHEH